jgi:N-acyl-phosphatidylethanolamine-hydrolysing phospholipase D
MGFVDMTEGILVNQRYFTNHLCLLVMMVLLVFFTSPLQAAQGEPPLRQSQNLRESLKAKGQSLRDSLKLRKSQNVPEVPLRTSADTQKVKYKTPWQRLKDRVNSEKLQVRMGDQIVTITTGTKCEAIDMQKLLQKGMKTKIMRQSDVDDAACICCMSKEVGRLDSYQNAVDICTTVSKKCRGIVPFKSEEQFYELTKIISLNAAKGVSEKLKVSIPALAEEGISTHDNSFMRYIWNLDEFYKKDNFNPAHPYQLKFDADKGYLDQNPQLKIIAINPYNHHFNPQEATFFNPWPNASPPTAFVNAASGILGKADIKNNQRPWFPRKLAKTAKPLATVSNEIRATMIGHATVLIQVNEVNIITDPIYYDIGLGSKEDKTYTGYKRIKDPGVTFENLPKLDFIVLSHNHRDHLDVPTLKRLEKDHPQVKYITPLGYTKFLRSVGLNASGPNRIFELDWWDSIDFPLIRFTALPTQHWCGRSVNDVNKMLWSAYAMTTLPKVGGKNPLPLNWRPMSIYFAGDTGFGPHFEEIEDKFPTYFAKEYKDTMKNDRGFDLSLIPIGAYCPMHKEGGGHINPYEAVKVHKILKSKHSIGIHFDTFQVAQEPYGEAPKILEKSMKELVKDEITPFSALDTAWTYVPKPLGKYALIEPDQLPTVEEPKGLLN